MPGKPVNPIRRPSTNGLAVPRVRPWTLDRRSFIRRAGTFGALATVGGVTLAACDVAGDDPDDATADPDRDSGTDDGAATNGDTLGDTLSLRVVQDIESLDPAFFPSTVDDAVMLCVAENLLTFRPGSGEVVNELAEEFESSADGLTHEFKLKEGILFHGDYGEVTAEDVKFSYERIADPDLGSTYQGDWAVLEEVEVTGEYTGVIRLREPFAPLMVTTLPGHVGMVISKAAYEDLGEDFATQPIGTGPYQFERWNRGELIVLRRFEDWGGAALEWADEPEWEEIRLLPIADDSAADIAVETGDAQFGLISHGSVDRFRNDSNFDVERQATFDYGWIGFNVTDEVLSDVNIRRAIRQALDIDSMIEAAFEGHVTRAHALISPEMPIGSWDDVPRYEQDFEAARAHLEAAGVDSLQLEMSIVEEPGARTIAEIVQANLAEIGIEVEIRLRERPEMSGEPENLQLFYYSFSNSADPSWATVWFTNDYVGSWNTMSWHNEEYDRLHEEAIVEVDEDARQAKYERMQELMDEDCVAAWVMYRTHHYAHRTDLQPSMLNPRYGKYRPWDIRST